MSATSAPERGIGSVLLLGLLWGVGGCAGSRAPAPPEAGSSQGEACVLERLYLGRSSPQGAVSDADVTAFLAQEVTPRFPDGLTLLEGRGQWRDDHGHIGHETTTVLEIATADTPSHHQAVDAISAAYCRRFHQQCVLVVVVPGHLRFPTSQTTP